MAKYEKESPNVINMKTDLRALLNGKQCTIRESVVKGDYVMYIEDISPALKDQLICIAANRDIRLGVRVTYTEELQTELREFIFRHYPRDTFELFEDLFYSNLYNHTDFWCNKEKGE
jgi:hypothetical protein